MKNLILLIGTFLVIQLTTNSQGCLPEGIIITDQSQIDNFQINYPNCTEVEGDVEINGIEITNLNGLNILTKVDGSFHIHYTLVLPDLSGLENITSIGGNLTIAVCEALFTLDGLDNLATIGGGLYIQDNMDLSSISALMELSYVGTNITVANNMPWLITLSGLNNIASIEGNLKIIGNEIDNLSGLNNLIHVGNNVEIDGNPPLNSLSGFENLINIGGNLKLCNNHSIHSFTGIENLETVGGNLLIISNNNLTSLSALENLATIGGDLYIELNPFLNSLQGINNINPFSIENLYIVYNNSLSTCEVASICEYITSPGGSINIYENANGCNTIEQVEQACESISIMEFSYNNIFDISPNPFTDFINFQFKIYDRGLMSCDLYELSGNSVKQIINEEKMPGTYELELDLSDLKAGVYFCVLKTNPAQIVQTRKLIKL